MNRSSAVMSDHLDRVLGAVDDRQLCVTFLIRRHGPVSEDLPVSLFVVAEQVRSEVVAATMTLTAFGIYLYLHCAIPLCSPLCRAGAKRLRDPGQQGGPLVLAGRVQVRRDQRAAHRQ